jgi:hypothetical protein
MVGAYFDIIPKALAASTQSNISTGWGKVTFIKTYIRNHDLGMCTNFNIWGHQIDGMIHLTGGIVVKRSIRSRSQLLDFTNGDGGFAPVPMQTMVDLELSDNRRNMQGD